MLFYADRISPCHFLEAEKEQKVFENTTTVKTTPLKPKPTNTCLFQLH